MSAVLSCGLTPLSGSLRLDSGPTDLVVKLGIAAAKILVSHIQMATFVDNASLYRVRSVPIFFVIQGMESCSPGFSKGMGLLQCLGNHGPHARSRQRAHRGGLREMTSYADEGS